MEKLAIRGGTPVRSKPFPKRILYGNEEIRLVTKAIKSQDLFYWSGTFVKQFEEEFPKLYGLKYGVASTSGTAAIHVAVGAVNPNPGDEIITAPITDLGSVTPILQQNAIPVFAEVDDSYNMDPADVERKITKRTKAIIAVHLFGNACNMTAMKLIAKKHNLILIEDCSQAHQVKYKGKFLGTIGDIGTFSLQGAKHMTTGDGGMTITRHKKFYERMKFFADKGYRRKGWGAARSYVFLAPCYRMNEQTAAIGLAQLKKVRKVIEKRIKLGTLLTKLLSKVEGIETAPVTPGSEHGYWLYPIRMTKWNVNKFAKALTAEGVPSSAGYIGKPIYVCAASLNEKMTYGDSHFPFDSPYTTREIEYNEDLCPYTQKVLESMVVFPFNECFTTSDIRDIAKAVKKVAENL